MSYSRRLYARYLRADVTSSTKPEEMSLQRIVFEIKCRHLLKHGLKLSDVAGPHTDTLATF